MAYEANTDIDLFQINKKKFDLMKEIKTLKFIQ
jgi:hypothetical protein